MLFARLLWVLDNSVIVCWCCCCVRTSCNDKLHINMKSIKGHRRQNKKHFNRPLNKGVMAWQKLSIYFLWSIILCSLCTDKLYRQLLLYISCDKNNLWMFINSKCFLVATNYNGILNTYTIQLLNFSFVATLIVATHTKTYLQGGDYSNGINQTILVWLYSAKTHYITTKLTITSIIVSATVLLRVKHFLINI